MPQRTNSSKSAFLLFLLLLGFAESVTAQLAKVLDRLPFEVSMAIVWQGQELTLRKVLSCDLRQRMYPGEGGIKPREVWDQSAVRTYFVLPSKEVLLIRLPIVCYSQTKSTMPVPAEFLPIMYWIDSAEAPTRAEQLVARAYFTENAKRKFEIRSVSIGRLNAEVSDIDDNHRLIWLMNSSATPDAYFVGVSAVAIPKSEWSRYPGLAKRLADQSISGVIPRILVEQEAKDLLNFCENSSYGLGPVARCQGRFDDRQYTVSASPVEAGTWRLDYQDVAVKRFARYANVSEIDSSGCNISLPLCNATKGTYRLEVDGALFELSKTGGNVLFDAPRQILLHVRFGFITSTSNYVN